MLLHKIFFFLKKGKQKIDSISSPFNLLMITVCINNNLAKKKKKETFLDVICQQKNHGLLYERICEFISDINHRFMD